MKNTKDVYEFCLNELIIELGPNHWLVRGAQRPGTTISGIILTVIKMLHFIVENVTKGGK